jgi:hypothetical protein
MYLRKKLTAPLHIFDDHESFLRPIDCFIMRTAERTASLARCPLLPHCASSLAPSVAML